MISCTSILVAIDFSAASNKALLYGRELARLLCARLYVIHVVSDVAGAPQELEETARTRLQLLTEDGADRDTSPTVVVRVGSSPAAEILDYVREHPIGLLVVGSHGLSGFAHVFLGSVAETVVRSATCPVLTVRAEERDFIQPATLSAVG